jgi:FixJ family two-component response regulator
LQAEIFSSAEEFLKAAWPEAPGCLVLDVRLPGVNGLDFQDGFVAAGIEIPSIFVTAHSDIPSSLRVLKGGAVGFLVKPFQTQALLTAVNPALETGRRRREQQTEVPLQSRIR